MTHARLRLALASLPLAAALALAFTPELADACGGTFCDAGPNVMPVDQTGENIVFWIDHSGDEPHTEAHIQIQYEGDAENFAWIIPVLQVPEVMVGNQALFDNLLAATVPTFTIQTTVQACADSGPSVGLCAFSEDSAAGDSGGFNGLTGGGDEAGDTGDGGEGPDILDRGFAGAFEYVVLTGDSVDEIVDWLDMAGYAQDPDAPPILQEYLDDDFVFVAVKLRGGVSVDEIHPLAIRYAGIEPCIPIKLTRIAAVDDMAIRAFFLGDNRVAPMNWPHVVVNPVRLDWVTNPAVNYREMVALALDEAEGRAFITEYAGTDAVVSTNGIDSAAWDPIPFETLEPVAVVDELIEQGLGPICNEFSGTCVFTHPQVEALLARYLPPPADINPFEFWGCLSCYEGLIDLEAWSGPGFATDFADRISTPGQHAIEMLETSDYLTRLFTLLSPHEMLDDPTFHETDSLPPVSNTITATRTLACEGNDWIDLEDGRKVALTEGGQYPQIEGMPAAERIERVPAMGAPQVETDNGPTIDELLAAWNHDQLTGPEPWNCSIAKLQPEALLTMLALFGVAGLTRGRRRRAAN